jgi:hypothetical protein
MMPESEMDIEWLTEQVGQLVIAAVDGESGGLIFSAIHERYGGYGIFCTCCALAETVGRLGRYERAPGYRFGFAIGDRSGQILNPDAVAAEGEEMAALVAAWRFVTAVLNRDTDQSIALFCAPQTDDEAIAILAGLVALVRLFGREKLAEVHGG